MLVQGRRWESTKLDVGKRASIAVEELWDQFKLQFDNIAKFSARKDCKSLNTVNLTSGDI